MDIPYKLNPDNPPPYSANPYPPEPHSIVYATQPPINPAFLYGGDTGLPPTSGYPPAGPGYPPGSQGYPPTQGYPPGGQGYPPGPQGYPPGPQGYPPGPHGYPPGPQGYPPGPQGYPPGPQAPYPPGPPQGYPQGPQGYAPVSTGGPPMAPVPSGYPQAPGGYMQPSQPISTQPTIAAGGVSDGWMSSPQTRPENCPPGLEYLTTIDQLLVHQKVEIAELITGFETQNKFTIKNSLGQKVFKAVEVSNCCTRLFMGPLRQFNMKIMDNFGNEVIHLYRPLNCDSCCFPCCLQKLEVYAPVGTLIGTVEQNWSLFSQSFSIKNGVGDTVFKIEGPWCTFRFCGDVEFNVVALDGETVVGRITKQWSGLLREAYTDSDFFGITFPMNLDVKMKAVMLGACFLIDMMFFEQNQRR